MTAIDVAKLRALLASIRSVATLPADNLEEVRKNLALIDFIARAGIHRIDGTLGEV